MEPTHQKVWPWKMVGWGVILWLKNSQLQCKLIWMITNFDKLKLKLSQAILQWNCAEQNFFSSVQILKHHSNVEHLLCNWWCLNRFVLAQHPSVRVASLQNVIHSKRHFSSFYDRIITRYRWSNETIKIGASIRWNNIDSHRGKLRAHTRTAYLNIFTENMTTKTNRQLSTVP